jgi:histidinol phosphatase-like PHP family hydrolase
MIAPMIKDARSLGALIVVVHGETIVEPVPPGTNREAIGAGADILAHPGLITEEEVLLAKAKNVLLEISARKGHSLSNGHVARLATKTGAPLLLNTDTHTPDNLINREQAMKIVMGAGLEADDLGRMQENSRGLLSRF